MVQLRSEFIQNYPSCVITPKKETFENYVRSLRQRNHETDSGYRLVYESNSNTNPWRADLKIKSEPSFPCIPEDRYKSFRQNVFNMRDISRRSGYPLTKCFRNHIIPAVRKGYEALQWNMFQSSSDCATLRKYRRNWYYDPLLFEIKNPYMRLIRKCRVGRSELACHSGFRYSTGRLCTNCNLKEDETLEHCFLKCPKFKQQRSALFKAIEPVAKDLGLSHKSVKTLLGFDCHLVSKQYRRDKVLLRRQLYNHTCKFMQDSNRFQFV